MERALRGMGEELKAEARRATRIAGLAAGLVSGIAAGGMKTYEGFNEIAERNEAHAELYELAMTTPLERATESGLSLNLPEKTPERLVQIAAVDGGYTDLVTSDGHFEMFVDKCGYTTDDGTVLLDALKCNDLYGFEFSPTDEGLIAIASAHGYTLEEISLHREIMEKSIVAHPSRDQLYEGAEFPTVDVKFHDSAHVTGILPVEQAPLLYSGYYDDASALAFKIIKDLDLTHADRQTQRDVELAVAEVIQQNIVRDNVTLLVSNDVAHLSEKYNKKALQEGYIGDKGEFHTSHMDELENSELKARQAWEGVTNLEKESNGPLHTLAEAHLDAHDGIVKDIFRSGQRLGIEKEFFTAALEDRAGNDGAADAAL